MPTDKARLRRARLIERIRAVDKKIAAGEAFRAESNRQKLEHLSERTLWLAKVYGLRDTSRDGADLRSAMLLGSHLRELGNTAAIQANEARQHANGKLAELANAERRRRRAEEARRELHRSLQEQILKREGEPPPKSGTQLE